MSITVTWADVVLIAPELSTVAVGAQNALLADVTLVMNADVWGAKLNLGAKYWLAHTATMNRRKGAGGALAGQTVGAVSRTFAQAATMGEFSGTSYGIIYEGLLMSLAAARFEVA